MVPAAYRSLFAPATAARTSAAKIVVRLAAATVPLAVVLLVSAQTGSFAAAGTVYALYAVGLAVGGPVQGRLCDLYGTRRVLRVTGTLNAIGVAVLVAAAVTGAPVLLLVVLAAAAGLMEPPVNPVMRAVWDRVHHGDPDALEAGHRWETLTVAATFLAGPLLVSVFVGFASAGAALVAAAVLVVGGTFVFTASPLTASSSPSTSGSQQERRGSGRARIPVTALAVAGCYTAYIASWWMMSVAIPGVLTETGRRPLSGLLIAMVSVGTLARGVWSAARVRALTDRRVARRFTVALLVLGAAISSCAAADPGVLGRDGSTLMLAACLLVAGGAVADAITLGHRWAGALTPQRSLTTMYALMGAATGVGASTGTAAAGALVDLVGGSAAVLLSGVPALTGAACGALLIVVGHWRVRAVAADASAG